MQSEISNQQFRTLYAPLLPSYTCGPMAFRCVVVTPEQQVLDESLTQAIVPTWDGLIGILTNRAPLLVKLGLGPLRVDLPGGQRRTFLIDGGVAQMKDNSLTILTENAIAVEDLDPEEARAELSQAEALTAGDPKSRDDRSHRIARARMKQELARAK